MKLSIVMATMNRAHLLKRSLNCYLSQDLPKDDFELIVVDDDSDDDTRELLYEFAEKLNIVDIHLRKPRGCSWRDCAAVFNVGIRAAQGDFIIGTHPEVMPGNGTLPQMLLAAQDNTYVAAKVYYLSPGDQACLDDVSWSESRLAVRELPGFYAEPSAEFQMHADYSHEATDRHTNWESFVFGGMTRRTWQHFGGFTEVDSWGTIDMDFVNRRKILGIQTHTLMFPETFVLHQNHDCPIANRSITPRHMQLAMANVPHYASPTDAQRNHLWR